MKTLEKQLINNRAETLVNAIGEICLLTGVKFTYCISDAKSNKQAREVTIFLNNKKLTSKFSMSTGKGTFYTASSLTKLKDRVKMWFKYHKDITIKFIV